MAAVSQLDQHRIADIRPADSRLASSIRSLGQIGLDPQGGVTRLGLTRQERAGREFVAEYARECGLRASVDPAANLILRPPAGFAPAGRPVLLVGSHLDTVRQGGALDGAYGVLAALEVVRTLLRAGVPLPYEPVVVGFSNEEGARFPCPFWGSKALTGALEPLGQLHAEDGTPILDGLVEAGGDPARLAAAEWDPAELHGYLELHIEQGPVLEQAAVPLGVVTAITGRTVLDLDVRGVQNHAGTSPMPARRDALPAAAEAVLAVEGLATASAACSVATTGRLTVEPGSTNVVPGRVRLTVEFRDPDAGRLAGAERLLREQLAGIAARRGVEIHAEPVLRCPPTPCDPELLDRVSSGVAGLGVDSLRMASGAGHDAQIMAARTPAAMIFVPSRNGISHSPEEHTDPDLLALGARALLRTMVALADRPLSAR
ncbi:MAG: Zn-dependent hydrolase [Jatrophihabitantaceae bacterium]